MRPPEDLVGIAEDAVRRARALGADAAEAFVKEFRATTISCVGPFVSPKESHGVGIGVRVAAGRRLGTAGGSGLDDLDSLLRSALSSARAMPEASAFQRFAAPAASLAAPSALHPKLVEGDPDRLADVAKTAMDALLGHPATSFASFTVASSHSRFAVANSEGLAAWDHSVSEWAHFEARVSRGPTHITAIDSAAGQRPIDEATDLRALATAGVERAAAAFDSAPLERPVDTVLLHPAPAAQLLGLLSHAVSAALVRARHSRFTDKMGQPVASPLLTLRDDTRGRRIDHEGVPPQPVTLVENGVLRDLLYDSAAAHAEGRLSNGHGIRPSGWLGGVGIRPHRLVVAPGDASLADLVASAERAVVVTDPLDGVFTSNETTGDFSLVAPYAFLVEGGKVRRALPPTTIAGNVHAVVQGLRAVGSEAREVGSGSFPALLAGGFSCAT